MRAVVCEQWGGPETLCVVVKQLAPPGEGEVKIRVRAAGVNFPDVLIIQKKYQVQPELPFTPGAEVAGEVVQAGGGVADLQPGQRVVAFCGLGGFAEEVIVPASACFVLPDGVGFDVAAGFLMAYGTSFHALRDRARLADGETLLVLGASGGVGLAALDIARALGARSIAAASSDAKLAICRDYGAPASINYTAEDLRRAIAQHTEGRGPDVIFDPVGGAFSEPAFRSIGWRGRHLVIGFAGGQIPSLPLNLPLLKGASLVGVFWGGFLKHEPQAAAATMSELLDLLASGRLQPLISARYALDQVPAALADLAARKVVGKIVVTP